MPTKDLARGTYSSVLVPVSACWVPTEFCSQPAGCLGIRRHDVRLQQPDLFVGLAAQPQG